MSKSIKQHALFDCEGEIVQLMRQTFVEPGYYVRINGIVAALSERSLEKSQPSLEIDNSLST